MSNASEAALYYDTEDTFGSDPGSPSMKTLRFVSESLGLESNFIQSNEIRSDRQVPDVKRVGSYAAGGVDFELSYGTYDELFMALLYASAYSSAVSNSGTFSTSGANITGTGCGTNINENEYVCLRDGTTVIGYYKVTAASANSLTVTPNPAALTGDGDEFVIGGGQILNGTTQHSHVFERKYTDLSNEYVKWNGMTVDSMSLSIATDQLITGSFGFRGAAESSETSGLGGPTAATTTGVCSASDDVEHIYEANASYDITQCEFTISNASRDNRIVGQQALTAIKPGTLVVTGTHRAYYATKTIMDKFLNATASDVAKAITDEDGNGYVFEFMQIRYTAGKRIAGGKDTDIIADMSWTGYMDPTEQQTVRIQRFPAA